VRGAPPRSRSPCSATVKRRPSIRKAAASDE
jgi:hypothetical protein